MRIVFAILATSVLSIVVLKYADSSIGETELMASPMELSAQNK